ncbi:hypothetical protein ACM65P_002631 [Vibrio alginolyticus]
MKQVIPLQRYNEHDEFELLCTMIVSGLYKMQHTTDPKGVLLKQMTTRMPNRLSKKKIEAALTTMMRYGYVIKEGKRYKYNTEYEEHLSNINTAFQLCLQRYPLWARYFG